MQKISSSLLALTLSLISSMAFGYNSIINTGNMTDPGTYKLGSELQFLTDDSSGANILLYLDLPTKSQSMDYRIKFGTGATDVNVNVAAKWIPVPDIQNQPALGLILDADWINEDDYNF